ncbi:hypothetical protein EVAR_36031_1 [Eumeta japonica]|uniref:Uncharacterized protein n=1 Tax=Eumeta variegata TaxID=151549 RepID=A0A4C1WSW5_EUMVA|nr:hypothetical protein EVAR_36031_1 [Eumeta japonica]
MIARLGYSTEIYSDNVTNLNGTEKELKAVMREETSKRPIVWKYIRPSVLFMGGAWKWLLRASSRLAAPAGATRTRVATECKRSRPHSRFHAASKHLVARYHHSRLPRARQHSTCSRRTNKRWDTLKADEETHHPAYTATDKNIASLR